MKGIDKQRVLSAIDSTIHEQHYHYKVLQMSLMTCLSIKSELLTAHSFSPVLASEIVRHYRQVTRANFYTNGFHDHPEFGSYTVLEQFRIRLLKLEQFRCHVLHYWKD